MTIRTGRNGETVISMLTAKDDGSIEVRLTRSKSGTDRKVTLREPTAREYAEIRTTMREVDRDIEDRFPAPVAPTLTDEMPPDELERLVTEYRLAVHQRTMDALDYTRDPEKPPYGLLILHVIERLGDAGATLDDLPVEALLVQTCAALMETWEAPLDGRVARAENLPPAPAVPAVVPPVPVPSRPPVATAPDSPGTEPFSPPGTEPASPSLPTPSTE